MRVKGPIPVTEDSHPFSSMSFARKVIDLEEYDFVEEEYFVSDLAKTYDFDDDLEKVVKVDEDIPYCTRILIRRPKSKEKFSGRLYMDILNASNNYDIEDLWRRSYLHIMENNHFYIGVTPKPSNILSLKHFDLDRYRDLQMPAKNPTRIPSVIDPKIGQVDGCEDGLVWDMLYQIAREALNNPGAFCSGFDIKYIYLTGQSQSGMYMNTYINYMHNYYKDQGYQQVFSGYLSLCAGGLTRALRQCNDEKMMMAIRKPREEEVDIPVLTFNTENDYHLFGSMGSDLVQTKNENTETNKRRYYDMTAAAHTDAASPLVPVNEEIVKTNSPPRVLDQDYEFRLNDLKFDYYINKMLDNMHDWVLTGDAPQVIEPIDFSRKDDHGHHFGGVRSPFIDVPKAKYIASESKGSTNGTMEFFSEAKMKDLYGTFENYLKEFQDYVDKQVEENLLTENDGKRAMEWAKNVNE